MKAARFLLILPFLSTGALADDFSFIRQIQVVDGATITTDFPLDGDIGQVLSRSIDADLAIFQLYTTWQIDPSTIELRLLDEKAVGATIPEVSIETFSQDPYVPTTTRSDQPYGVRVTVSGLNEDPSTPNYTQEILLGRGFNEFDENTFVPTGAGAYYEDAWSFAGNGTTEDFAVTHEIPGGTSAWAVGAEKHSVYAHPDSGLSVQIASAEVIIFPMAFARIDGILEGETYFDLPDTATATLEAAYPRSNNYVRIYPGPQTLNPDSTILGSTVRTFGGAPSDPNVPQGAVIEIGSIAAYADAQGDGEYTIEVVTETPFSGGAPEVLSAVSFKVDRTVKFNGALYIAE
ncbi:MAG: hypothetical protein HKN82_19165 [Akkermansiaceae bacterium]|nr:hypothetical protein [Akkermansiaceae bacterium]